MGQKRPSLRSARGRGKRKRGLKLRRGDGKILAELMSKGRESVRVIKRARSVELLSEGNTARETAGATGLAKRTVEYIKARYVEGGLERALRDLPRGKPDEALNGKQKQKIVAMVCTRAPEGRARWSVRLIASEAVDRGVVPRVGRETIRLLLRDHDLKPWREKNVVHPGSDAGIRGPDGGTS